MIEAQLAVQRYRAGSVDHLEDRVRPTAEGEEAPAASPKGKEDAPSQIPPPPPPLKQEEGNPDVFEAAGGGGESEPDGGVPGTAAGCRKTEEAEALASQLQIIAMHLVRVVVFREGRTFMLRGRGGGGRGKLGGVVEVGSCSSGFLRQALRLSDGDGIIRRVVVSRIK